MPGWGWSKRGRLTPVTNERLYDNVLRTSRMNTHRVGKTKRRIIAVALLTIFIVVSWFLCVDLSWFVEYCPTCVYGKDILQYRVCTIPLYERTEDHVTLLQRVAEDMGVECIHPKLVRWHKHRYWGLCICTHPVSTVSIDCPMAMIPGMTTPPARLREMVRTSPSLRDEFTERALKNHDAEYWWAFVERLKSLRVASPAMAL